jgi:hypothetical protein
MTIQAFPPVYINATSTGTQGGNWVAESNYFYNVAPNNTDPTKCVFQIACKLNLEFDAGGSVEYFYGVDYLLTGFTGKPEVGTLIYIAGNIHEVMEAYFIAEDLMDHTPGVQVWMKLDDDVILEMTSTALNKAYPEKI